jgi:hypothetical protein
MIDISTAKADRKGTVVGIAAPDYARPDKIAYFTFAIQRTLPTPGHEVLYLNLNDPAAATAATVISAAFASGHELQIGLKGNEGDKWRTVCWVQSVVRR